MTTLKIEQYDFVSFCQDMYNAFKQGYEPVWTSDDSPQQIGFCFHAILHKKPVEPVVVGKAVFEASIDTAKLQEQLKEGGEIEQMLADSLVVEEKLSTEEFTELADKAADLIDKVDNLLVEAEAKHIEATTPVKATPKQTRGKKQ